MRTDSTAARRAVTSIFVLPLVAVVVAVGLRQDRDLEPVGEGETGVVAQVLPAAEHLASLSTAPEAGALAPNFRLRAADGELVELADLRGTPVFINFWASWYSFCLTEMPAIQKVSNEYGDEVIMMGVNVSDSPEDIAIYARNNGIHYTLPIDTERVVMRAYGVRDMRASVFIDEHGVVSSVVHGVIVPDQMRENIDAMLD